MVKDVKQFLETADVMSHMNKSSGIKQHQSAIKRHFVSKLHIARSRKKDLKEHPTAWITENGRLRVSRSIRREAKIGRKK